MPRHYINRFTSGGDTAFNFKNAFVGYWPLQEPAGMRFDHKKANNLTDNATVGFSYGGGPGGAYPHAALFAAASSEFFSRADNADISAGDIDFMVGAWVRLASKGADRTIISKWNGGTQDEFTLRYETASDRFQFIVSHDGTGQSASVTANNFGAPAVDTWYFVYAFHSASLDQIGIAVNNGTRNTASHSTGVFNGTAALNIGALAGAGSFWDGRIAGAFFMKPIPTEQETAEMYNSGVPVTPMGIHVAPFSADPGLVFPLNNYEWQTTQPLRSPRLTVSGADYALRLRGGFPGLKGVAQERIRFTKPGTGAVQDAFLQDNISWAQNFGLGKLWTVDEAGVNRWAWASFAAMPDITVSQPTQFMSVVMVFDRWSNWMDKNAVIAYHDAGANFVVTPNQSGNAPIFDPIWTFYAETSWTNPFINNSPTWLSNLYKGHFETSRDISTNVQRIQVDVGRPFVGWSTDNGQTFADDIANMIAIPTDQFMFGPMLIPGANLIGVAGTPSAARVSVKWFNQWHM